MLFRSLESLDNGTTFLTHENDNYLFIVELLVIQCFFWSLPSLLVYQTVRFVKRFSLLKVISLIGFLSQQSQEGTISLVKYSLE